jgi:hypothetical protein
MKKALTLGLLLVAGIAAATESMPTRYGPLKTDQDDFELLYKGKSIVQGNNGVRLLKKFQVGESDVVLIQDRGGNGCPSLYRFVSVTASGGTVSELFGSCNDLTNTTQNGDTILVTVPGYLMVNGVYKESGEKTKCLYEYKSGSVVRSEKSPKKLCAVDVSPNVSSKF